MAITDLLHITEEKKIYIIRVARAWSQTAYRPAMETRPMYSGWSPMRPISRQEYFLLMATGEERGDKDPHLWSYLARYDSTAIYCYGHCKKENKLVAAGIRQYSNDDVILTTERGQSIRFPVTSLVTVLGLVVAYVPSFWTMEIN